MKQPPLNCPTCGFPSITVGQDDRQPSGIWVSCVACCRRREDWEAYLSADTPFGSSNSV